MKVNDQFPVLPAPLAPASRPNQRVGDGLGGPSRDGAAPAGGAGAPAAKVAISARSRELHEALRAANAAPDVREDVVADVRARITSGSYRIDPERIARGILDASA